MLTHSGIYNKPGSCTLDNRIYNFEIPEDGSGLLTVLPDKKIEGMQVRKKEAYTNDAYRLRKSFKEALLDK